MDEPAINWSRAAALPCLLALCMTASAHHSGLYDDNDVITISGTITAVEWFNPHVRITLETASSTPASWLLEGTSVNALQRWGIRREQYRVGETLTARGPRSKFGRNSMIAATTTLADGSQVVLWPNVANRLGLAETGVAGLFPPPSTGENIEARGIFRVWTPRGRPPTSNPLPLTAAASELAAAYDALRDDPALRCVPPGMPVMLDTPYPIEFVDRGATILMRFEEWDGERTVYMRPGSAPPVQDPSPMGVSFGRWEGTTLAIFTLYINYPYFDDLGTPQSPEVTVLERYTPNADESRLDWETTVTDASTFTYPIVRRGYFAWEPGEQIKPFNCTLSKKTE